MTKWLQISLLQTTEKNFCLDGYSCNQFHNKFLDLNTESINFYYTKITVYDSRLVFKI